MQRQAGQNLELVDSSSSEDEAPPEKERRDEATDDDEDIDEKLGRVAYFARLTDILHKEAVPHNRGKGFLFTSKYCMTNRKWCCWTPECTIKENPPKRHWKRRVNNYQHRLQTTNPTHDNSLQTTLGTAKMKEEGSKSMRKEGSKKEE